MKHIKRFEDVDLNDYPIYKEEDYIKLTEHDTEDEDSLSFLIPYGVILASYYNEDDGWEYQIGYYDQDGDFIHSFISGDYYIERLMTTDEKEYFESDELSNKIKILKDTKKYNL